MKNTLTTTLLGREVAEPGSRYTKIKTLYDDKRWVDDLDIVNELDGHSGCVNALSWSRSGRLLASGSDDQHLNIHTYNPTSSTAQFALTTTVATGHTQNIFSVKFMPQSNDRTVVTAAGDGEIRVFDLEYAGQARQASVASNMAAAGRRHGRNTIYNGVRYLSDGDTDCRVYRSHGDRVKRIVTESSPNLFLTCSEDGEVRQWDLRQPSSAYPSPSEARQSGITLPPALISYKRFHLDLNTISCSPSQPHYIALGGAHLHAFLHDRRMTGRDLRTERGTPASASSGMTDGDEELMGQATRCVRKFAPNGQRRMRRTDNGHITALKISDARPDEMVVSWSGEHIYSFDLIRSPDAGEQTEHVPAMRKSSGDRVREGKDRKRKRKTPSELSVGQEGRQHAESRRRLDEMALRVQYQNGQSEDLPLAPTQSQLEGARRTILSDRQRNSSRIAKATVNLRQSLFSLSSNGPEALQTSFTKAFGHAAAVLPAMDEFLRTWRYPLNPSPEEIHFQQTLRRNRESARRLVQAGGTLARVLGGRLQTPSGNSPMIAQFASISPRTNDDQMTRREVFGYDFLRAILLWLDSGIGSLVEGFTRPSSMSSSAKGADRLPIPESEASSESIDEVLIPYLLALASNGPIVDIEANRFQTVSSRQLFETEKAAVLTFAAAVKIPFADLSSAVVLADGDFESRNIQAQDRQTALRYWALKIGRGVLLNAAEGVNYAVVDRAFGGLGKPDKATRREERALLSRTQDVSDGEEEAVTGVEVVEHGEDLYQASPFERLAGHSAGTTAEHIEQHGELPQGDGANATIEEDMDGAVAEQASNEDNEEDDEDDEDDAESNDSDSDREDDDDEDPAEAGLPRFVYSSAFERRRLKEKVEDEVPCSPHTRVYRGHCNVKTVKDVNFYGMGDEYVVSGSDDGHLFIWDRKTSKLVNILEGDGEVVNVIQGHPYEPLLAVSGIDHTIKIFSPDARAREMARLGHGVMSHDPANFSSIAWPSRGMGRRTRRQSSNQPTSEPAVTREEGEQRREQEDETYVARNGLASRRRIHQEYQITNQNDVERQGGNQEAFLTRSMLAQLAQTIRAQRAGGGDEDGDVPMTIQLGDNCAVM